MPDSRDIQIQKLFIYDPASSRTVADIYVGKASDPERLFQKLILILDFPRRTSEDGSIIDRIIKSAAKSFEEARQFTPELVLETVLETLNILLPTITPKKNARWLSELSMLVGISERGQVHFSQLGSLQAFLAQGTSFIEVSEEPAEPNPLKLFSHITSGILNPGDALLMTTVPLMDYIAHEKLKHILLQNSPETAIQKIEGLLAQVPPTITFAAIIVKFTTEYDEFASRESYDATSPILHQPEAVYDDITSPSPSSIPTRRNVIRNQQRITLRYLGMRFFAHAGYYILLMGRIFMRIASALKVTLTTLVSRSVRISNEQRFIATTKQHLTTSLYRFRVLPKRKRIALLSLAILCFILLHILLIKGQDQKLMSIRSSYDDTLFMVNEQKQAAANAILYGDEPTAETIYVAMLEKLNMLTPLNKKQEEQINLYMRETERELNKVRHINTIDSPLSLGDLNVLPAAINSFAIGTDASVLLGVGNDVYRFADGTLEKRVSFPQPIQHLLQSGDTTLAFLSDQSLTSLRGTEQKAIDFKKHPELKNIDAITLYMGNLYLLDRGSGMIFKHEGSGTAFRAGSVWLNDKGLLSKANSLAIDGEVYLTTTDGEIIKLLKGARQNFNYHTFTPKLGSRATVYTTKESSLLYILDPDNKRIAILGKDGAIKDQFTSPSFNALKSLSPNNAEDALYVLNDKAIYILAIKK